MNRAVAKVNSLFDTFNSTEELYSYLEGKKLYDLIYDILSYRLTVSDMEAIKVIVDDVVNIFSDGKLNWEDSVLAISMITNITSFVQRIIAQVDKAAILDVENYRPIVKLLSAFFIVYYVKADRATKLSLLTTYLYAFDPLIRLATGLTFKFKGWIDGCCKGSKDIEQQPQDSKKLLAELKAVLNNE